MPGTTQLALYNGALIELGEATLASTSEDQKSRRVLDSVYSEVVADCVEAGAWNFALKTVEMDGDTGLALSDTGGVFGYRYGYAKPTDWVRTIQVSEDENFAAPLFDYADEDTFLFAQASTIYWKYVSNDTGYGLDLNHWPQSFIRYVQIALAERACMAITQSETRKDKLEKVTLPVAKRRALGRDAMNEATKFFPPGTWNSARGGGRSGNDRGGRGRLTG